MRDIDSNALILNKKKRKAKEVKISRIQRIPYWQQESKEENAPKTRKLNSKQKKRLKNYMVSNLQNLVNYPLGKESKRSKTRGSA